LDGEAWTLAELVGAFEEVDLARFRKNATRHGELNGRIFAFLDGRDILDCDHAEW